MNVKKTILAGNPNSDLQLTEVVSAEHAAKNLLQFAERVKVTAETCAFQGECFDKTERAVWDSVLQTSTSGDTIDGCTGPSKRSESVSSD